MRHCPSWPKLIAGTVCSIAVILLADRGPLWPGIAGLLIGQALQVWAAGALPRHKNEALTTSGPYAWVRNPMYLGRFCLGLGLVLLVWRWYLAPVYVVAYALYAHFRVAREERRLRERFGDAYDEYSRRVRRWLPRWPGREGFAAPWSLAHAWGYGQIRVALALIPFLAAVIARREWH